jgi:hypothetical protein
MPTAPHDSDITGQSSARVPAHRARRLILAALIAGGLGTGAVAEIGSQTGGAGAGKSTKLAMIGSQSTGAGAGKSPQLALIGRQRRGAGGRGPNDSMSVTAMPGGSSDGGRRVDACRHFCGGCRLHKRSGSRPRCSSSPPLRTAGARAPRTLSRVKAGSGGRTSRVQFVPGGER